MQINRIGCGYNYNKVTRTKQQKQTYNTNPTFEGTRVSMEMLDFEKRNSHRMPTTLKLYLDGLSDRYAIKPAQAMKNAYSKLQEAKTIEDVQRLFPDEERFIYLEKARDTQEDRGLLGIFKEFKELYDSVLKSGEDLTLYIVRKIYYNTNILEKINEDLENDLHDDIKAEFKRKRPKSVYKETGATKYLDYDDLKSLGIYYPDKDFFNSLKFSQEGYSDKIGAIISESLRLKWENMPEEERFAILSERNEGRENWWKIQAYDKKLEYAAGEESGEDLYKEYKKYVNAEKRRFKKETQQENSIEVEKTESSSSGSKKVSSNKLSDKEKFIYWVEKRLENFYEKLSEADKDTVHIKRVRKQVLHWQQMTPEEKAEFILEMKTKREPGRIIMIDAWNHSTELIKELSKFLKSKQILKPVDVFFESEEYKGFQSKIMTEFWAEHRDLAEEFGKNIRNAYLKVESAMNRGVFKDLRVEVLRDQKYRKKLIERERLQKEAEARKAEAEARRLEELKSNPNTYKYEFTDAYRKRINSSGALPASYIKDVTEAMIEMYPKEIIQEYTEALKNHTTISTEAYKKMSEIKESNNFVRSQRAIEMALSDEFFSKWSNPEIYERNAELLIPMFNSRVSQDLAGNFSKKEKMNLKNIESHYNEYRKELRDTEIQNIINNYFTVKDNIEEEKNNQLMNELIEYLSSYGRSILPLFDTTSLLHPEQKVAMNEKFLNLMPENLKNHFEPLYKNSDDIVRFSKIHLVNILFDTKYKFLPQEIKDIYIRELDAVLSDPEDKIDVNGKLVDVVDYFMQGLASETEKINGLKINKKNWSFDDKLKMLAIEQALADELADLCSYNAIKINMYDFEDLYKLTDAVSKTRVDKNKSYIQYNGQMLILSRNFNFNNVRKNYNNFMKEFREIKNDLKDSQEMNVEDILFTLNPDEKNELKDKYIIERMEKYGFTATQD